MTHVTRRRHWWTVSVLGLLCLGLIAQLVFFENRTTSIETPAVPNNQTSTVTPPFLQQQESVTIPGTATTSETVLPIEPVLFQYVEIINSCDIHFEGDCVIARTGPDTDFPLVAKLRNHVVLKVAGKVEHDGQLWYKIDFDEFIRYPERIAEGMYVPSDRVTVLLDEGEKTSWTDGSTTTTKRIVVNRATQKLIAYDGDTIFMETLISTGLELSPTAAGTFTIYKKTPSRYMQGPLPGFTDEYDLPGVPWNLYFTNDGAVIHGAYWHDSFGSRYSHGCVNLTPEDAQKLYTWAPLGTKVIVQ